MKPNRVTLRLKKLILYAAICLLFFLFLLQSERVIFAVQNALVLCYKTIIPTLFPFFIISGMLTSGSFIKTVAKWLSPVMRPVFSVSGAGALPFAIGIVSGYPMGAKVTTELYCTGNLGYSEAMRLLPFTNNSGPLFIIGAVGTAMLGDPSLGMFLYGIHLTSSVLVGLCFRFYKVPGVCNHTPQIKRKKQSPSFSDIMANSIHTMLLVCGFIIFFAAITACIAPLLSALPRFLSLAFSSILEVTNGTLAITQASIAPRLLLSFLSAAIGFGGICVMMQVFGIITPAGLSIKTYVIGKILHGLFSGMLCYLAYPFVSTSICPVFSAIAPAHQAPNFLSAIIPFVILFICLYLVCQHKKPGKTAKN